MAAQALRRESPSTRPAACCGTRRAGLVPDGDGDLVCPPGECPNDTTVRVAGLTVPAAALAEPEAPLPPPPALCPSQGDLNVARMLRDAIVLPDPATLTPGERDALAVLLASRAQTADGRVYAASRAVTRNPTLRALRERRDRERLRAELATQRLDAWLRDVARVRREGRGER